MEPGDTAQASLILNWNSMQNARLSHYELCKIISLWVLSACKFSHYVQYGLVYYFWVLTCTQLCWTLLDQVKDACRSVVPKWCQKAPGTSFLWKTIFPQTEGRGRFEDDSSTLHLLCTLFLLLYQIHLRSSSIRPPEAGAPSVDDEGKGSCWGCRGEGLKGSSSPGCSID